MVLLTEGRMAGVIDCPTAVNIAWWRMRFAEDFLNFTQERTREKKNQAH